MDDETKSKIRLLVANRIFFITLQSKYTPAQRLLHTEWLLDIYADLVAKEAVHTIKDILLKPKATPP